MSVKVGDKFKRSNFAATTTYQVYSITGANTAVPNVDGPTVHMEVVQRGGWFNAEPFLVSVPEKFLLKFFERA